MDCKTYEYKNIDDCSIMLDVYESGKSYSPAIVYIHGGGFILGSRKDINKEQVELYTNNGYTVISIDYRLAPRTKLASIIQDIKDAFEWIYDNASSVLSIDANKIAVIGSSAGGFLSLITGTFELKPNAIVSIYGYGDILSSWALNKSNFYLKRALVSKDEAYGSIAEEVISEGNNYRFLFYMYCRQSGNWVSEITGHNTLMQKKRIKDLCPISKVDTHYPPTLFIHGDKDEDVPYAQSEIMYAELKQEGLQSKLIKISGGIHEFEKNMTRNQVKKVYESILEFFKQHL